MDLKAFWGKMKGEKRKQLLFEGESCASRFLAFHILSGENLRELENRGYDISTLKFSIKKKNDCRS